MSVQQHRQTQSPDGKSGKARNDACEVKQRMTTHWDMDHLSREELEAEMAKGFGYEAAATTGEPEPARAQGDGSEGADEEESPLRIGITLLILSVVLMAGAVLLLQSGGS